MKAIKKILTFVFILFIFLVVAQPNPNTISHQEFMAIEIDGVSLQDIIDTKGESNKMELLFGLPLQADILEDEKNPYAARFEYTGKFFAFSSLSVLETELVRFELTGIESSITIQGKTIKIGDPIINLGIVKLNTDRDGSKSILYASDVDETIYLAIDFDQDTKVITRIFYFVLT